jgi:hypothetical protein
MMKPRLNKYRTLYPHTVFRRIFYRASLNDESTGRTFVRLLLKPGMKAKSILAIALVTIMMISVFAFLLTETQSQPSIVQLVSNGTIATPSPTDQQTSTPTGTKISPTPSHNDQWNPVTIITEIINPPPKPAGLIESNPKADSTMWKAIAANAWNYFQPDRGVDPNTGLPKGTLDYPYFTDWDLGAYIQAVIDANKSGLIGNDGEWNSSARLDKVLNFLKTRDLNEYGYPFWVYQSADGKNFEAQSKLASGQVDAVDTGRLLVALKNLELFNSSLTPTIESLVKGNKPNYAALLTNIKNENTASFYTYFVVSGYASFWPNELSGVLDTILNNIISGGGNGNITTYGVSLPKAIISCEPLLSSIFDLNNNSKLNALASQVYLAHEAYYNATGKYVAFSEGNDNLKFIYEWVVLPNGDTWKITNAGETTYLDIEPIIYTKVSFGFMALYNTTYARNMTIYLERSLPDAANGYSQGAEYNTDDNARNIVSSVSSNTNGMILSAARYAIQNNP